MNTRRNITWWNQRLHQWENSVALSTEKLVHKKEFWAILAAMLLFGLILALIITQSPITGEFPPIPGYP